MNEKEQIIEKITKYLLEKVNTTSGQEQIEWKELYAMYTDEELVNEYRNMQKF